MIAIRMLTVSTSLAPFSVCARLAIMEMGLTVKVSLSEQLAFFYSLSLIIPVTVTVCTASVFITMLLIWV